MAQDNTKLCDFSNTNNNGFISTSIAPTTNAESCEINAALLNLVIKIKRLRTSGGRSNRSAKKIIVVGIGKVTQFSIILSRRDKQAIQHTSKQEAREKRRTEKRGRIKRQG